MVIIAVLKPTLTPFDFAFFWFDTRIGGLWIGSFTFYHGTYICLSSA